MRVEILVYRDLFRELSEGNVWSYTLGAVSRPEHRINVNLDQ